MQQFVFVALVVDITPGSLKQVEVDGTELAIANVEGRFFAIDNECTHSGCPLADGELDGYEVTCGCHGSRFDVRTGGVLSGPALDPVATFPLRLEGDRILVAR